MTDAAVIPMLRYQVRVGFSELRPQNKSELDRGFQMEPEITARILKGRMLSDSLITSFHLGPTVICFSRKRVWRCP